MKKHAFTAGLGAPTRQRPADQSHPDSGTTTSPQKDTVVTLNGTPIDITNRHGDCQNTAAQCRANSSSYLAGRNRTAGCMNTPTETHLEAVRAAFDRKVRRLIRVEATPYGRHSFTVSCSGRTRHCEAWYEVLTLLEKVGRLA